MHVKKVRIENFKTIKNCEINLNNNLNVFTGVNNSGKTTILEGIALWSEIFYKLLSKSKKRSKKPLVQVGEYKFSNKANYFDYSEFSSIRVVNFNEIFHNLDEKNSILLSLILESNNREIEISFTIKSSNGKNLLIYLSNYDDFDYESFNRFFQNRSKPISVFFANPVNHINKREEKKVDEVIEYYVTSQKSEEIFRNRLFRISRNPKNLSNLERDLGIILGEDTTKITIENEEGMYQKILLKIGDQMEKDISLYGSGTLQILQFLINIYEDSGADLKLVLFDEPDSHIHRNIQKRLIEILLRNESIQLFLTTHNESFIRSVEEDSLFLIEKNSMKESINPIGKMISLKEKSGIMTSRKNEIIKELSGEEITGLHFVEALEADRIIFVEGKSDVEFLETVFARALSTLDKKKNIYWVFNGIDSILNSLMKYREVFRSIKNGKSLWDKTYLLMDRDLLSDNLKDKLENILVKEYGLKVYITDSYSIETLFFKDLDKSSAVLENLLREEKKYEDKKELQSKIKILLEKNILEEVENEYRKEENRIYFESRFCENLGKIRNSEFFKSKKLQNFFNDYSSSTYERDILKRPEYYKFLTKDSFYRIIEKTYFDLGVELDRRFFFKNFLEKIREDYSLRPGDFEEIILKFR